MDALDFNLAQLVSLPRSTLVTREFIVPVIYRLSGSRRERREGERVVRVEFLEAVAKPRLAWHVRFFWDVVEIARDFGYDQIQDDLRGLAKTRNENVLTETAALGVAFSLMSLLLPQETISRVAQIGDRGDYFLNSRRSEMIEVGGTRSGRLTTLFGEKRRQVLARKSLTKAYVSVTCFDEVASILERVR